MYIYIYIYIPGTTKDALNQTTKAQPVRMIANSEINENGKFSLTRFGLPSLFFKESVTPPLPHTIFLEILLSLQKRGRGQEPMLTCKDAQLYAVWIYIRPSQNFMLAITVLLVNRIMPSTIQINSLILLKLRVHFITFINSIQATTLVF